MVFRRSCAVFVLAALLAAGCGGASPGSGTPSANGRNVSAKQWMGDICTALDDWQKPIRDVPDTAADANLPQVKPVVVNFLDGLVAATETIIAKVNGAGTPGIDNGGDAVRDLKAALAKMQMSVRAAKTKIEAIPDKDPATFPNGLIQLGTVLQTDVTQSVQTVAKAFEDLLQRYPALAEAGKDVPACNKTG
jgi:hypothetical protein